MRGTGNESALLSSSALEVAYRLSQGACEHSATSLHHAQPIDIAEPRAGLGKPLQAWESDVALLLSGGSGGRHLPLRRSKSQESGTRLLARSELDTPRTEQNPTQFLSVTAWE